MEILEQNISNILFPQSNRSIQTMRIDKLLLTNPPSYASKTPTKIPALVIKSYKNSLDKSILGSTSMIELTCAHKA